MSYDNTSMSSPMNYDFDRNKPIYSAPMFQEISDGYEHRGAPNFHVMRHPMYPNGLQCASNHMYPPSPYRYYHPIPSAQPVSILNGNHEAAFQQQIPMSTSKPQHYPLSQPSHWPQKMEARERLCLKEEPKDDGKLVIDTPEFRNKVYREIDELLAKSAQKAAQNGNLHPQEIIPRVKREYNHKKSSANIGTNYPPPVKRCKTEASLTNQEDTKIVHLPVSSCVNEDKVQGQLEPLYVSSKCYKKVPKESQPRNKVPKVAKQNPPRSECQTNTKTQWQYPFVHGNNHSMFQKNCSTVSPAEKVRLSFQNMPPWDINYYCALNNDMIFNTAFQSFDEFSWIKSEDEIIESIQPVVEGNDFDPNIFLNLKELKYEPEELLSQKEVNNLYKFMVTNLETNTSSFPIADKVTCT